MSITKTALYRHAKTLYTEHESWKEHEPVYSESLKLLHDDIRDYLELRIEEQGDMIHVSYTLKKADLEVWEQG